MRKQRSLVVLGTCCLSLLLVTMNMTLVNVALPAIRRDLHASVESLAWAIDGYTIVVASLLLPSGAVADRFGRRRTFSVGLALFSLGSLACSLAPTAAALVAFRMLQAVGGSMLNPVAMAIVAETFPDAKERARAIGIWGAVFGVSMAAGPLLGGVLVESLGWRSIFWTNVPIAVAALALTARFVPESRAERRAEPLFDLAIFRGTGLLSAMLLALLSFAAFSAFLFLNALYLQEARGLRPSAAGLATLPVALALVVSSPLSGRLVGAGYARVAIAASGAAIFLAALALTRLTNQTGMPVLIAVYALFGAGVGAIGPAVNTAAIAAVPRAQTGLAAAIASTSRQVGAALGVAMAGVLAGSGIEAGRSADLARSTHAVFWAMAAQGLVIVAVGVIPSRARLQSAAGQVVSPARGGS